MELSVAAILFDLDGVLIDSTRCVERHWRAWAEKQSLDAENILRMAHGVRNVDTMRLVAPHLDVEHEAAQFAASEVADTAGVAAVEGATHILAALHGFPWAVVTSGSAALALARIRAAQLPPPPVLITGDDVARGKPDAEPYMLAANRLEVSAEDCVVVEDAPAGVTAGKRAGMHVIGIAFTYGRQELLDRGTDFVLDRLIDLNPRRAAGGHVVISPNTA